MDSLGIEVFTGSPLREFKDKLFHLHAKDVRIRRERINDIAISGNGEPTSAQEFAEVIEIIGDLRELLFPGYFGAKGLTVEKVFDQNKGKYRAAGTGKATIGGETAQYVVYSPAKDVLSRAFFLVHGGKAFRITINMYKLQENEYLAAFEKTLGSLKWK